MYPHDLHCPTNINEPQDIGVCDRCYRKFYLSELVWQWDQRGNSVQNLRIRVCRDDLDEVATTLAPIVIVGPEGVVRDPRPYFYAQNNLGGTTPPNEAQLSPFPWLVPDD